MNGIQDCQLCLYLCSIKGQGFICHSDQETQHETCALQKAAGMLGELGRAAHALRVDVS